MFTTVDKEDFEHEDGDRERGMGHEPEGRRVISCFRDLINKPTATHTHNGPLAFAIEVLYTRGKRLKEQPAMASRYTIHESKLTQNPS